jgi:hypothetical protein
MTHNKWKILNPNYEIFLFDDSMCEKFLLKEYSELHYNIFKFIPDGPIKSDFWRLCILYKYGGIYVDADIHPLISLDKYLITTSDFVTCITKENRNFNPHFIATKKKEPILQLCINEYIAMYTHIRHLYNYNKWSIVNIFNKYLNYLRNPNISTVIFKNKRFQFFVEKTNSNLHSPNLHDYYCVFKNIRLFNSRYINYHPYEHQFKDSICVSHNNDKGKYGIISFEMNQTIHSNKIKNGVVLNIVNKRSIVGKNNDIGGKNISMSRNIGRSISRSISRSMSRNMSRNMSRSMSRNMSRSIKRKITNEKKINQRNIMSRSSKNNQKIVTS